MSKEEKRKSPSAPSARTLSSYWREMSVRLIQFNAVSKLGQSRTKHKYQVIQTYYGCYGDFSLWRQSIDSTPAVLSGYRSAQGPQIPDMCTGQTTLFSDRCMPTSLCTMEGEEVGGTTKDNLRPSVVKQTWVYSGGGFFFTSCGTVADPPIKPHGVEKLQMWCFVPTEV